DGAVESARDERSAIGGKRDGVDGALMPFETALFLRVSRVLGVEIVEAHPCIGIPAGSQRGVVRPECEAADRMFGWMDVLLDIEGFDDGLGFRIPDDDFRSAAGREVLAV